VNMRNEDFSEKQVRELENELRGFGTPYSADEPDSRYFANFRVRVMERIREEEAAQTRTWYEGVMGWIEDHVLVTSLSTAAVLVAVWGALMMQPLEPARHHQVAVAPKQEVPQVQSVPTQSAAQNFASAAESPKFVAKQAPKKAVTHIEHQPDMAMSYLPVATAGDVRS